jgi:hypothetical protein
MDMELVSIIVSPDWNRRFTADVADDADAK